MEEYTTPGLQIDNLEAVHSARSGSTSWYYADIYGPNAAKPKPGDTVYYDDGTVEDLKFRDDGSHYTGDLY